MESSWERIRPYGSLVNTSLVEPRGYQINIALSIYTGRNSLVVLPTGLGKTLIAVLAVAKAVRDGKKAAFLAPTKPLSEQHYNTLVRMLNLPGDEILLLTGKTKASEREALETHAKVIAATPQTIANDIKLGKLSASDFGVVIFDECHKAVGKYAYTYVADECKLMGVQLIGLTASPGSSRDKINMIVKALGIENIEIRTSMDADVVPYVMDKSTMVLYVDRGSMIGEIMGILKPIMQEHMQKLYSKGLTYSASIENMPKKRLIEIGNSIQKIEAPNYKFMALFHYVYLINLFHAYELVSTEGLYPFVSYFDSLNAREKKSRAVQSILASKEIANAIKIARESLNAGMEHPKMARVVDLVKRDLSGKSMIIFAQYRSTIRKIAELLNSNGIDARTFAGKKDGVTLQQQQAVLDDFRQGKFKVLVSTSIGEEGLDIPSVDAVIFYEPIPSEIRTIQRKGRAGRMRIGHVIILVARGTKDEAYLTISRTREKRMRETVEMIRASLDRHRTAKAIGGTQQTL